MQDDNLIAMQLKAPATCLLTKFVLGMGCFCLCALLCLVLPIGGTCVQGALACVPVFVLLHVLPCSLVGRSVA